MKYSLIIPCKNGGAYLPTCVNSIISQSYSDFELIISDDHSEDNTGEYLDSINDSRVKKVIPPNGMSMAEHWEWALQQAQGEWVMFVGQDDLVQNYFFKLADIATRMAKQNGVYSIMSKRAYFFWPGCEFQYGNVAIDFDCTLRFEKRKMNTEVIKTLLGFQIYFVLPEMYTNSLFHRDLLKKARTLQEGRTLTTHPQDANLAAIAARLEDSFIYSHIPLGWIGSSPKSAGLAITAKKADKNVALDALNATYINSIKISKFSYNELAGDFSLGSHLIYFWQALISTINLEENRYTWISSKVYKICMFTIAWVAIKKNKRNELKNLFIEALQKNGIGFIWVQVLKVPIGIFVGIGKRINSLMGKTLGKHKKYSIREM